MKKARVIYNPSSGREEGKKRLPEILNVLEEAGYEASSFATKGAMDATYEAERCAEMDFELVVAVGGDGTVYEVINGLSEQVNRPRLAVIPLGTTNDFARAIGMPRDFEGILDVLKKGITQSIDIGKMNDKYFINVAGGGSLTELTYEVPSKMKTAIGQLAYYLKGVEKMSQFRPYKTKITIDGQTVTEEIMLFMVSNTNSVGGFNKFAPGADFSDGYFDVIILKKCNLAELGRIASLMLSGEHLKEPKVMYYRTNNMIIESDREIKINLDGEFGGVAPCEFALLNKHLEVIINTHKQTDKKMLKN